MLYIRVLLENTTRCDGVASRHGLSVYAETPSHRLLFDMGPDDTFLRNAGNLGIDISAVDTAVLSHGHHDHGGGLETFFRANAAAPVYLRPAALDRYYSTAKSPVPRYIGLEPPVLDWRHRMRFAEDMLALDGELTLFPAARSQRPPLLANSKLRRLEGGQYLQDDFRHELNLLITAGDKALLLAGCAHNGIVPILERCVEILGRAPDAVLGGFHLFSPGSGETEPEPVIREIGRQLAQWPTHYYTGHCTGPTAFAQLQEILGDRLHPLYGGLELTL